MRYMDKGRRHEIKMLKFKKRLRLYDVKQLGGSGNFTSLRTTSKPRSCIMCSPYKYDRKNPKFKKQTIIDLTK